MPVACWWRRPGPPPGAGPLRAFFLRIRARRGQHVAAVATARKLAIVIWHLLSKGESYAWARPSLHAKKLRDLELKAGYEATRGQRGAAHAYNLKSHRDEERRWVEQAERPTRASLPAGIRADEEGTHRRRNRGATIKAARQGLHLTPCSSPRGRPCAEDDSPVPQRKLLSITSSSAESRKCSLPIDATRCPATTRR